MDVDKPGVAGDVLEGIVVPSRLTLKQEEDSFFEPVSPVQHIKSLIDVLFFKYELEQSLLSSDLGKVDLSVLAEDLLNDTSPVLKQALTPDLVRVDVV